MIHRNARRRFGVIGGVVIALALFTPRGADAQEHGTAPAPPTHSTSEAHPTAAATEEARPVLPPDPSAWVGTLLIIIVAMFLMAAVIGPMVRIEIPVESHDDHGHAHDDHGRGQGHDDHGPAHGHH